ncbi:MAG: hypothetical protein FRX49_05157 [Trebouxia sp. A1-2]|nr:MAG: hypothetical protein FRX49_05157 [Trebouxia sp. A1-2]
MLNTPCNVLSWLGDLSMWRHRLCEDMAGLSRPTDWAKAAIWLLCAQMEQILITMLLIQVQPPSPPAVLILGISHSYGLCAFWTIFAR